jgi:hypothetical protein
VACPVVQHRLGPLREAQNHEVRSSIWIVCRMYPRTRMPLKQRVRPRFDLFAISAGEFHHGESGHKQAKRSVSRMWRSHEKPSSTLASCRSASTPHIRIPALNRQFCISRAEIHGQEELPARRFSFHLVDKNARRTGRRSSRPAQRRSSATMRFRLKRRCASLA